MKRTFCLLLALLLCLSLVPAVRADVLWIPEDAFLNEHMDSALPHERSYFAAGPDGHVTVYASPESAAVEARVENGEPVWISWEYTGSDGVTWGYTEHYDEDFRTDWTGWIPLDYLLLKYDHISFREEFGSRITDRSGTLTGAGSVVFWDYPGSESISASLQVEEEYLPEYQSVFTDDAGREWGCVGYYMGIRNTWICLDAPAANYDELYAEHPPQQVTHPVQENAPDEIKPAGPNVTLVLLAVCAVAVVSGGFLWITRKKK